MRDVYRLIHIKSPILKKSRKVFFISRELLGV